MKEAHHPFPRAGSSVWWDPLHTKEQLTCCSHAAFSKENIVGEQGDEPPHEAAQLPVPNGHPGGKDRLD